MEALERDATRAEVTLTASDPYWPAQLAVAAALLLYVALPDKLTLGPDWLLPAAEGLLLIGLVVTTPRGAEARPRPRRRGFAVGLALFVAAVNLVALGLLVHFVVRSGKGAGYELVLSGAEIWATNVLIFAVVYWELDGGGPEGRRRPAPPPPWELLFAPMTLDDRERALSWRPGFVDYLYTSFTNCTAFSPTDTMPLSLRAKGLMMVQGLAALVTIGVIIARAIGSLG